MAGTRTLPDLTIPAGQSVSNAIPAAELDTARAITLTPRGGNFDGRDIQARLQVTADGVDWADWYEADLPIHLSPGVAITTAGIAAKGIRIRLADREQGTDRTLPSPWSVAVCVYDPWG